MRCLPVRELRMAANSICMKISDCPGRVSVAQWSERRYVDSETLDSIPGWNSQSFRIYNYDRTKILCSYKLEGWYKLILEVLSPWLNFCSHFTWFPFSLYERKIYIISDIIKFWFPIKIISINSFPAGWAFYYFTLANARRFNLSRGEILQHEERVK